MKKKWPLILLMVVLGLLMVLILGAAIYWNAMLNKITRVDETSMPTLSEEEIDEILNEFNIPDAVDTTEPTDPLVTDESEIIGNSDSIINIMLLGRDTDASQSKSRGRTDTMILCTINTETKTVTFTSFLRDLYVKLPDFNDRKWGYNRLNANYSLGGREMLDQCLRMNFGIAVDHFVEVDFSGFAKIVELMGGVDMELTAREAAYLNGCNKNWNLRAGVNHLNGQQTLTYSRIREIDGDFQRSNRQRTVLSKLLNMAKEMNPAQLHALLCEVLPMITTDMSNGEITDYAFRLIPMLPQLQIQTLRIPADGTYYPANKGTGERPMSVIVPDLEANRQYLREKLGDDLFLDES